MNPDPLNPDPLANAREALAKADATALNGGIYSGMDCISDMAKLSISVDREHLRAALAAADRNEAGAIGMIRLVRSAERVTLALRAMEDGNHQRAHALLEYALGLLLGTKPIVDPRAQTAWAKARQEDARLKIEGIKEIRTRTNAGLKEAKEAWEAAEGDVDQAVARLGVSGG